MRAVTPTRVFCAKSLHSFAIQRRSVRAHSLAQRWEPFKKFPFKLKAPYLARGARCCEVVGHSFLRSLLVFVVASSCSCGCSSCQQLPSTQLPIFLLQDLAAEIILTLGEAFEVAYQMAVKEQCLQTQQQQQHGGTSASQTHAMTSHQAALTTRTDRWGFHFPVKTLDVN